jgi:transcriptional regulator with XRE-family HTH domain
LRLNVVTLSFRLKLAMICRGFESQGALSRATDVPEPAIKQILSDTMTTPDAPTLQKLADALEVSPAWLREGNEGDEGLLRAIEQGLAERDREMQGDTDNIESRLSAIEAMCDECHRTMRQCMTTLDNCVTILQECRRITQSITRK